MKKVKVVMPHRWVIMCKFKVLPHLLWVIMTKTKFKVLPHLLW